MAFVDLRPNSSLYLSITCMLLLSGCSNSASTSTAHTASMPVVEPSTPNLEEFTGDDWNEVGVRFKEPEATVLPGSEEGKNVDADRREVRKFAGHTAKITGVAFSGNGQQAVSCSDDGTVRLWDVASGREVRKLEHGQDGKPTCIAHSKLAPLVACGFDNGALLVWQLDTNEPPQVLDEHEAAIHQVAVSPAGKRVATADEAGQVIGWTVGKTEPNLLLEQFGHQGQRYFPTFGHKGEELRVNISADNIGRWSSIDWSRRENISTRSPLPNARVMELSGEEWLVAANRRTLVFLQRNGPKAFEAGKPHVSSLDRIHQVAQVTASGLVAAIGGDGSVEYWRPEESAPAGQYPMPVEGVTSAAWNPADLQVLSGHEDGTLVLWQLPRPSFNAREQQQGWMHNLASLLYHEQFEQLDTMARQLRKERKELPTHQPALAMFYEALDHPKADGDWNAHFARVKKWRAAQPESLTATIVEAKSVICQGYLERGGDYGISRETAALLGERLQSGLNILREAAGMPERDPEVYAMALSAHRGLGISREDANEAFRLGREIDPYYFPLYEDMAVYLLPRWQGEEGDIAEWSKTVCDTLPERRDEFYARIACYLVGYENEDFLGALGMDLDRIRRGLNEMKPDYRQDRWLLNCGALFACLAGDPQVAHENFQKIGEHPQLLVWRTDQRFYDFVRWADPSQARGQEKKAFWDRGLALQSAAFTADGKHCVTVSRDHRTPIKVWSVEDGKMIHSLSRIGIPFNDALFHPKMPVVITAAGIQPRAEVRLDDPDADETELPPSRGSLMEWNLIRPDEPRTMYNGGVKRVVLSRDARLLAASCMDKKVRIWDLYTSDEPKELPQYDVVTDMEFSPNGDLLATQITTFVQIWDLESGKEKFSIGKGQVGLGDRRNLRFSPDGKILSFGNLNGQLVLWNLEKQQAKHTLSLKPTNLYQTAFSANGKLLATADDGYSIRLWNLETGKELHEFRGHTTMLMAIEFIADGKTLASAGYDGAVKLWDVAKWIEN